MPIRQASLASLSSIYGPSLDPHVAQAAIEIAAKYEAAATEPAAPLTQLEAFLIAYPDQIHEPDVPPLESLAAVASKYLNGVVTGIHILPFYPWSSDDGFSVIEPTAVAAQYGSWSDIRRLAARFHVMFDAVINHVSAENPWFRQFLENNPRYQDFFINVGEQTDLSAVVRPRAQPVISTFQARGGDRRIWTTFGPDQVDLNYSNPNVLLAVMEVLLFYASMGASFIRLDAVAYLWKQIGTSCINLPETHEVVRFLRSVLDDVAPQVRLIAEANMPQAEALRYLGDGEKEAHLIYNFALPPLVLHAFHTGQAGTLARWAAALPAPRADATYFNVLATHDGIGVNAIRGILGESALRDWTHAIESAGGLVSSRRDADGSLAPYEINANYLDALQLLGQGIDLEQAVQRFLTSHAILLSFTGLPGIYFHSLFGSRGWSEGVRLTGRPRTINREKLDRAAFEAELADLRSLRSAVFSRMKHLLSIRSKLPAFAPHAGLRVLASEGSTLAWVRGDSVAEQPVLCVYNVGASAQTFRWDPAESLGVGRQGLQELISGRHLSTYDASGLRLGPYEAMWLTS